MAVNEAKLTYDGIDLCGDRMVEKVNSRSLRVYLAKKLVLPLDCQPQITNHSYTTNLIGSQGSRGIRKGGEGSR